MTILDIYSHYNIMPNLQLHQLRVAAVAKIILDNFKTDLDSDSVIKACLLHDMGNIIKFDLSYFPEFTKPEGLEYWQGVKDDFVTKHGTNEHVASIMIARELGMSDSVIHCIEHIGFTVLKINEKDPSFEYKICNYADMRVGPYGVLSISERLADAKKRYENREDSVASNPDLYQTFRVALEHIEGQIQDKVLISLQDITHNMVEEVAESLKSYEF